MNMSSDRNETYFKRYKSYPAEHFSRWRSFFTLSVLYCFIIPYTLLKYRPKIYGRENIPKSGPFIVAANHISMLDPPLISTALRYPVAYMAKKELFRHRLAAEFFRSQGCFALDRDNPDSATLRTALNVLKSPAKWVLGIFPEGTRGTPGKVSPFRKGLGALAQKTGTPILPVGVSRDEKGRNHIAIGKLITDVSNAERVQEEAYKAIVSLTSR